MKRTLGALSLVAVLATAGASVQPLVAQAGMQAATGSPAVAFVYVSSFKHINGYAVSSSGRLTPLPGSPFSYAGYGKLSVTSKFLFGMTSNGSEVTSFSIASDGAIKKVDSLNVWNYEPGVSAACVDYPDMQVDFAQSTVYVQENPQCADGTYQGYLSLHIEKSGDLQYIGSSFGYIDDAGQGDVVSLAMAGTDKYAYDGWCGEDDNNLSAIDIYERGSNGVLQYIGQDTTPPTDYSGPTYCAGQVAADSENHLAVAFQRLDQDTGDNGYWIGPYFLASYSEGSNGNLTTTSNSDNMPEALVSNNLDVATMSISPSNKFLAVGGQQGFQIFHFNGSNPITAYSGVVQPNLSVFKFGWDKANHLYVFGAASLRVYTVTTESIKEAPGSPYSIQDSTNLIVLDR